MEKSRFLKAQIYGIKRRSERKIRAYHRYVREGKRRVEREKAEEIIGMGGIGKNSEKY
ncbi:hypothetical protein LR48_Vigan02g242200 [Vigna angularis]|uniref:Uncharacterized protein n=1 Tax=Phaseolus angularis TaxID=3914 RepID=A0A0L9U0R8_PHAAN|nr:hypothetical protein LR48_Vigan02g242200 [Vigna angularis]